MSLIIPPFCFYVFLFFYTDNLITSWNVVRWVMTSLIMVWFDLVWFWTGFILFGFNPESSSEGQSTAGAVTGCYLKISSKRNPIVGGKWRRGKVLEDETWVQFTSWGGGHGYQLERWKSGCGWGGCESKPRLRSQHFVLPTLNSQTDPWSPHRLEPRIPKMSWVRWRLEVCVLVQQPVQTGSGSMALSRSMPTVWRMAGG